MNLALLFNLVYGRYVVQTVPTSSDVKISFPPGLNDHYNLLYISTVVFMLECVYISYLCIKPNKHMFKKKIIRFICFLITRNINQIDSLPIGNLSKNLRNAPLIQRRHLFKGVVHFGQ